MKDTNKPQWLIDAENEIKNFEESNYGKLTDKEFKRKEAASFAASCVSKENKSIKGKKGGLKHVESGHLKSISRLWNSEEAGINGKKGGSKNVETGWIKEFQNIGVEAAAIAAKAKKQSKYPEFLALLPNNDITYKMAEEATILIGYAKRQTGRLIDENLELQNEIKDKSGRTRWSICTYKKK
jgi:hypothetical protein